MKKIGNSDFWFIRKPRMEAASSLLFSRRNAGMNDTQGKPRVEAKPEPGEEVIPPSQLITIVWLLFQKVRYSLNFTRRVLIDRKALYG